jgi:hypothetical protein
VSTRRLKHSPFGTRSVPNLLTPSELLAVILFIRPCPTSSSSKVGGCTQVTVKSWSVYKLLLCEVYQI